jgi:WD40 repeat protein
VNGAPVVTEKDDIIIPNPDAPLTIGQAENLGFFSGLIDEVAIYHRALSPDEIKARWSALAPATKAIAQKVGPVRRLKERLVGDMGQPWKAAFLPDGKRVLSAGFDKVLRLWDAETGRELRRFEGHSEAVTALAISPDGRLALSGGGASRPMAWVTGKDLALRLWDLTSGKTIRDFKGHTGIIWCLAFSPDGRRALSGSRDHTARLWDVATGREVRRFQHNDVVLGVCFSPDGKWGLSSTEDGDIVLWELETGRDLRHFKGHGGGVECVAFSPDGRQIMSADWDGTVRLWDARRGKEIRHLASWSRPTAR